MPSVRRSVVGSVQEHSLWCWAAVAQYIAAFYGKLIPQCQIASLLKARDCCQNPLACNKEDSLHRALEAVGCPAQVVGHYLAFEKIVEHFQGTNPTPICCRIDWGNGNGHFIIVIAVDSKTGLIKVFDPDPKFEAVPRVESYDSLCLSYRGLGRWSHTYFL